MMSLETLVELPPSAIKVIDVLLKHESMTPKDIVEKLKFPQRTVSFALRRLMDEKIIKKVSNFSDMRQPKYFINGSRFSNHEWKRYVNIYGPLVMGYRRLQ